MHHARCRGMIALGAVFMFVMVFGSAMTSPASAETPAAEPLRLTHGIASGDVTATEVVIWARANRAAQMVVEYTPAPAVSWPPLRQVGPLVEARDDITGKVVQQGLMPDTRNVYWVRLNASPLRDDIAA